MKIQLPCSLRTFVYLAASWCAIQACCVQAMPVVNVYIWGGEIPKSVFQQFERQYHIHVNVSTYDNNETLYAKLKATRRGIYDVIMPSGYYVERMRHHNMLLPLDHTLLPNRKNLDPFFINNDFDNNNQFSIPLTWGITGIFYNTHAVQNPPRRWQDLWQKRWRAQLLLPDDAREVFAIALLALGYSPNDPNPQHIHAAYQKLLTLIPNIKLFASESIQAILIDEDAQIGSSWNGDANKAQAENTAIRFTYPEDGFVIWIDCLAIPKNAPHPHEAHQLINYLMSVQSGRAIAEKMGFSITNKTSKKTLPATLQKNPLLYPPAEIMKRGYFQQDVGEETVRLTNTYWEKLKLAM